MDFRKTVRDRQTGREVKLSDDEVAAIRNIQTGRHPVVGFNPYQVRTFWGSCIRSSSNDVISALRGLLFWNGDAASSLESTRA